MDASSASSPASSLVFVASVRSVVAVTAAVLVAAVLVAAVLVVSVAPAERREAFL